MENNNFILTHLLTSGDLISSDDNNALSIGTDGKLFVQPSLQPTPLSSIICDVLYEGALRKDAVQELAKDVSEYKLIMVCATALIETKVHTLWTVALSTERNIVSMHWFQSVKMEILLNIKFKDKTFKVEDYTCGSGFSDLYVSKVVGIK